MAWQFSSDRPIYIQVSEQIVSGILTGEYARGQRLPSVRELAVEAAVNPNTVQRAMSELESVGLICTQRNTGKFVTEEERVIEVAREKRGEALVRDFFTGMAALGYTQTQAIDVLTEFIPKEGKADERGNA